MKAKYKKVVINCYELTTQFEVGITLHKLREKFERKFDYFSIVLIMSGTMLI